MASFWRVLLTAPSRMNSVIYRFSDNFSSLLPTTILSLMSSSSSSPKTQLFAKTCKSVTKEPMDTLTAAAEFGSFVYYICVRHKMLAKSCPDLPDVFRILLGEFEYFVLLLI